MPVSIVMLVKGVVPIDVSSLVNCDSYSCKSNLRLSCISVESSCHGGSIKGVRCNGFGHHFLQCDTVSMMCLSLICGVQYYQLKVSNVFPFVKGEVFISVIGDKNVDQHLVLYLVNAINYVNIGVSSLGCAVIHDKMCCMCGDEWSTDLNRYYTIVSRWYLKG